MLQRLLLSSPEIVQLGSEIAILPLEPLDSLLTLSLLLLQRLYLLHLSLGMILALIEAIL
jgi:hypothetical protein